MSGLQILITIVARSNFEVFYVFQTCIGNFLVLRGWIFYIGEFLRLVEEGWIWSRWLGDP